MWEDVPFVLFFFHLLTLSPQSSSSPHLTLENEMQTATSAQGGGQERAGAGQTRLGGPGPLTVRAGYGVQSGLHGPGRKARHSAWKSGQTAADWEQKEEWA